MGVKVNRAYFVLPARQLQQMAARGNESAQEELERRQKKRKRKKKTKKF